MSLASTKPSDVDIMMFCDGELEGTRAEAVALYLKTSEEGAAVRASLEQVSELVRGSVELEADRAEEALAGLWAGIERAVQARDVEAEDSMISSILPIPSAHSFQKKTEDQATAALVEKARWFGGWQSHAAMGLMAAAVMFLLMSTTDRGSSSSASVAVEGSRAVAPALGHVPLSVVPQIVPVVLRSQAPEVEALEVYDGSGVIMKVAGDASRGESASTVIWISRDTDVVEDPI